MQLIHNSVTYTRGLSNDMARTLGMISYSKRLKSFLKTGISTNLDVSKDNYLRNKCEEEDIDEYITPLWDTDEGVEVGRTVW